MYSQTGLCFLFFFCKNPWEMKISESIESQKNYTTISCKYRILENLSNIICREFFYDMKKKRAQFTLAICVNVWRNAYVVKIFPTIELADRNWATNSISIRCGSNPFSCDSLPFRKSRYMRGDAQLCGQVRRRYAFSD